MDGRHKKSLKERCKLTKFFYKNGQRKIDHDKVLEKSEECTKQILEAKKNDQKTCRFKYFFKIILDYIKPFTL